SAGGDMRDRRSVPESTITSGLLGLCTGLVVATLAVLMAGGGHGWTEGLYSMGAVILVPIAGLAWAYRRRRAGLVWGIVAMFRGVLVDWFLWTYTGYIDRVHVYMPVVFVAWLLLWVGWQCVGVYVIVASLSRS